MTTPALSPARAPVAVPRLGLAALILLFSFSLLLFGCLEQPLGTLAIYGPSQTDASVPLVIPANATTFAVRATLRLPQPATVNGIKYEVRSEYGDAATTLPLFAQVQLNGQTLDWKDRMAGYSVIKTTPVSFTVPANTAYAIENPLFFYRAEDRTKYPSDFTLTVTARDSNGVLLARSSRFIQIR